jgi:predicted extracellular nuclease
MNASSHFGLGRLVSSCARIFAICAFSFSAVCAHAQSNVLWNFGTAVGLSTPSSGLPLDVTGGAVTQGNNNGTTTLLTTVSVSSGYAGATGQFNAGAAARVGAYNPAQSTYFQFTLTPLAGLQLTLSGLQFGSRSTGTGPQVYAIYTSLDSFTTPVASGTFANNSVWVLHTPSFASVTGGSGAAITVRIFGFGGTGSPVAGTANWRIDDLRVTLSTSGGGTAPVVTGTTPANGAGGIALNVAPTLTFDQPVSAQPGAFTLSGTVSGAIAAAVSGGPTTFTLTPAAPFANGETITVTALAALITDQATGTLNPAADFSFNFDTVPATTIRRIHEVQGPGASSPLVGQDVTVQGVVVGAFPGTSGLRGFFVQEEDADADTLPTTSEGIFVFDSAGLAPSITVGSFVTVTGRVVEFNGLTELAAPLSVTVGGPAPLPTATPVTLPFASATAPESLEGMRVTLPQTLFVTETFNLGQFGEFVVSSGGILPNPTNIVAPGAPAIAQEAANELNRLEVDDGRSPSYPDPTPYLFGGLTPQEATLRIGDTVTALTGVITYQFGDYALQPTAALAFTRANPRMPPAATPCRAIRVASANVLNFFNGDGAGGGFPTSRGATTAAELARQRAHLVTSLVALDADIVGLIEMENDGFGATSAIQEIVNALNAALPVGAGYTFVDLGGTVGSDAITCGFIYKPSRVSLVGPAAVNLDPLFSRPPVAQTFVTTLGEVFTVCVNHFKSKGSPPTSGPNLDQGDGQGAWNLLRTQQSEALALWLAGNPTGNLDPDKLIIGDLNAYAKEDPIEALLDTGYVNVVEAFEGPGGYSFVFDGEAGHLDHGLASPTLSPQVVGAFTWHNNSAEPRYLDYNLENKSAAQTAVNNGPANDGSTPWRASDHDPIVIDLTLGAATQGAILNGTPGRDTIPGTPGDDVITGGFGADTITGAAGRDRFVYTSLRDANDTIADFAPGVDRLDLSALLSASGYTGSNPLADGYVRVVDLAVGASVQVDTDGPTGAAVYRPLVTLQGLTAAQVGTICDLGL